MRKAPALPIRTQRLILRPFVPDDLEAFGVIYARADVVRYLNSHPWSTAEARRMLERIVPMNGFGDGSDALRLAVILPETGALIGDVSCWQTSAEHNQGEIGFVFHPDHHGHGYATEAVTEVLRAGFEVAGFHRMVGRADARNGPSARLMERLGMRREAHLHENAFIKGEWTDELVYAMLGDEWRARQATPAAP